jgi:hypothetical protein
MGTPALKAVKIKPENFQMLKSDQELFQVTLFESLKTAWENPLGT